LAIAKLGTGGASLKIPDIFDFRAKAR
jgi:hypothetical protein